VVLALVINAEGFEKGLSIIAASLTKKSGVKTEEKVYERVGRLKQKYPSVSRYYQIDYIVETEIVKTRKAKETAKEKAEVKEAQKHDSLNVSINHNAQWKEIIRMMNTQKAVTTVSQNRYDQVIISHRCSEPNPKVEAVYRRLNYKSKPKTNRKFVVHKSEFQKLDPIDVYLFPT